MCAVIPMSSRCHHSADAPNAASAPASESTSDPTAKKSRCSGAQALGPRGEARGALAGERRRLAQKARVVDLLDQEVRHVGARDEPRGPVARIDQDMIAPRPWSVRQNGWTNDRPVEPTAADDAFLHILVGVNAAKEEAKGGVVEEATVATAVPCSEAGHADQALARTVL